MRTTRQPCDGIGVLNAQGCRQKSVLKYIKDTELKVSNNQLLYDILCYAVCIKNKIKCRNKNV